MGSERIEARAAVRVRDALPADAAAIARVAREVWPATYAGLLDDAFIELVLTRTYEATALSGTIAAAGEDPGSHFLVAEDREEIVGYLHYGPGAGGPELHRLYVLPARTREGTGAALLAELNRRLAPGTAYVALVHAGNDGALRFYAREGFSRAGRVDGRSAFLERYGLGGEPCGGPGCDVIVRYEVPEG